MDLDSVGQWARAAVTARTGPRQRCPRMTDWSRWRSTDPSTPLLAGPREPPGRDSRVLWSGLLSPAARGCHAGPVTEHHVVAAIRGALAAAGDPERAVAQQAYMKSEMPFRGIGSQELTALLRPILADPAYRISHRGVWDTAVLDLWDAATHREERYAAIALTGHRAYRAWQDPDAVPLYEHLVRTGAWWDLVDLVASNRIGPILLAHREAGRRWSGPGRPTTTSGCAGQRSSASWPSGPTPTRRCCARASSPTWPTARSGSERRSGGLLRQYARTDPEWVRDTVSTYGDRLSGLSPPGGTQAPLRKCAP